MTDKEIGKAIKDAMSLANAHPTSDGDTYMEMAGKIYGFLIDGYSVEISNTMGLCHLSCSKKMPSPLRKKICRKVFGGVKFKIIEGIYSWQYMELPRSEQ